VDRPGAALEIVSGTGVLGAPLVLLAGPLRRGPSALCGCRGDEDDDSVAELTSHRSCGALLVLDDVKDALGLIRQSALGMRAIPVDHVVGTVGRCQDFDRCFEPLRADLRRRMDGVRSAFPTGDFPPIEVFQIDEAYFVMDGHHRVALARELGVDFIDAQVTQIHGPYRFGIDVDPAQVELTGRERLFLEESGLAAVRPAARVCMSSPTAYAELLEGVKAHGYDLIQQSQQWLPPPDVAARWYDCVYRPTLQSADTAGLTDLLPSCRDGDIFLGLHRSHRIAFGTECAAAEDAIHHTIEADRQRLASQRPRLLDRLTRHRHQPPPSPPLPRRS
jgi:hypothetical protein